uniref:Putative translation initiation factor IF-2 n=1 Tax=Streptomyces pactum TaxID=68249 RepID=B7TWK3_9ACTN|nr:putative translation initiation factor IF-2 [Streptomyces pactum]
MRCGVPDLLRPGQGRGAGRAGVRTSGNAGRALRAVPGRREAGVSWAVRRQLGRGPVPCPGGAPTMPAIPDRPARPSSRTATRVAVAWVAAAALAGCMSVSHDGERSGNRGGAERRGRAAEQDGGATVAGAPVGPEAGVERRGGKGRGKTKKKDDDGDRKGRASASASPSGKEEAARTSGPGGRPPTAAPPDPGGGPPSDTAPAPRPPEPSSAPPETAGPGPSEPGPTEPPPSGEPGGGDQGGGAGGGSGGPANPA